jgi:hypothetical protein
MPRPIVEVLQTVATVQTTVTDPTQATLIVGPNYNIIDYDATAADRSSSKIADPYDPYAYGSTAWSGNVDIELDSRGNINSDSIKVYLEDVYYEVGATSDKAVRSTYGAGNVTTQNLSDNATSNANWSYRLGHTTLASFEDPNTRSIRDGDIVQIEFPLSSVFTPTSDFSQEVLSAINSEDNYLKIAIPAINGGVAQRVFKFSDPLSSSLSHVDLYEIPAVHAVFSEVDAQDNLKVTENTACTITVHAVAGDAQVGDAITGTLHKPVQTTSVKLDQSANDLSYIHVKDRLRQFVSAHLALDSQLISCRIEALLSEDYTVPNGSVYLPNEDADWTYSTTTKDLTFGNAITLSDTDIANAATISAKNKAITRATIYIASKSLNVSSTTSAVTVSSFDLESKLGVATPENPLGLAASIALQNSGTSTVKVLRIKEDSSQGLLDALPYINADPNVYSIIPLTQDISVISTYVTHAANQSKPSVGKFRVVLGSAETAPLWRYWAGTRSSEYGRASSNLASGFITNALKAEGANATAVVDDPEGGFLSVRGPSIGDTVVFSYVDVNGDPEVATFTCTVASVESNARLTVNLPKDVEVVLNSSTSILYTGARSLVGHTDDQVEDLLATIAPLTVSSDLAKRLVMVYPGEVSVGDDSSLPGYYLTAALGGMLAAFEPHRPKNQIAISGIADIEYSNLGYFTDEQIDRLSDGGYFVFIQEIAGGLPFCVHQVTAAYRNYAGTQEFSELSVVNNFDYVSSVFKNSLNPYVGVWNIIPQAFSSIMASLDSAVLSLQSRSSNRIGAPLLGGDIISVEQSEADAGTVNVVMDIQLPKVLNKIRLEVISQ